METKIRKNISIEKLDELTDNVSELSRGFETISDHVIITDEHANILYANKAAEKNTGYSRKEMLGKNPGDLWGGKMSPEFYQRMWHRIKIEKRPFVGEALNVRKDGTEYWQELHIFPVLDQADNPKFFIGIEPNITDKKKQEFYKGEFFFSLRNGLRANVTATRWLLDWLYVNGGLNFKQKDKIEAICRNNENISRLIAQLSKEIGD